ncbi:MAG: DMT family transporter [Hyphomicrobiaceae bacterium]
MSSSPLESVRSGPALADYLLLFLLAAIWGGSFTFIKMGVATVPAATTTFSRLVVASAIMLAITAWKGERMPLGGRLCGIIFLTSITGNALPFTLISWGEERIDSGLAAILMGVMPLTAMLIAHALTTDDRLTPAKMAGVALGFAGLVVLIGPSRLSGLGGDVMRELAVAAAAVSYGINANVTRSLTGAPQYATIAAVMMVSALIMLPVSLVSDRPWTLDPSLASVLAIVLLGIFQTAIGTVMLFMIVRRQGASFFSQINFLVPISGVIWGAVVLGERPGLSAFAALATILLGVAVARMGRRQS